MRNIIFHIDVNSAFLSWEAVFRLAHKGGRIDLWELPSAVGGDASLRHGIILAKSLPAKKYRIKQERRFGCVERNPSKYNGEKSSA